MIDRAIRRIAAASGDSLAVRLVTRAARILLPPASIAPGDPVEEAAGLAVVRDLFAGSRLAGPFYRYAARAMTAWPGSAAMRGLARRRRDYAELPIAQRVHLAGVALATAVLADGLVSLADPRPASAFQWVTASVLLAAGLVIALSASAIAAAWPGSRLARRR
jgi:hypothetical protein